MSLYNTPYINPNEIVVVPRGWQPPNPEPPIVITRYNWDNSVNNQSPWKWRIEEYFSTLDVRVQETICLYLQYEMLGHSTNKDGTPFTWRNDVDILTELKTIIENNCERIKLEHSDYKYYNPMTFHIEYKLENGMFVETEEIVKSMGDIVVKVDILKCIDDSNFIEQCMPAERRQQRLDNLLEDLGESE